MKKLEFKQGQRITFKSPTRSGNVKVTDYKISDCECKAREFRPHSACKHMKRLHEKLTHLSI